MKEENNIPKNRYALLTILLIISTMIMSIGYAVTTLVTTEINGEAIAKYNPQTGVYISDYKLLSTSYTNSNNQIINYYYGTMVNGKIELDNNILSTVSYTVEVKNNSEDTYKFDGIKYDEEFYDNSNIIVEYSNINLNDKLLPNETKTFTITFKYNETPSDINKLNYYINTSFIKLSNYTISYTNFTSLENLPTSILEGETLEVDLPNSPKNITVNMNSTELVLNTDYTYENGKLTIPNVNGNIEIINKGGNSGSFPSGSDLEVTMKLEEGNNNTYTLTISKIKNIRDETANDWIIYIKLPADTTFSGNTYGWGDSVRSYEDGVFILKKLSYMPALAKDATQSQLVTVTFTTSVPKDEFYPFEMSTIINPE